MKKRIVKILMAALCAVALGVMSNFVYDYVKNYLFVYIYAFAMSLYRTTIVFLNWSVKMWMVILGGMVLYYGGLGIKRMIRKKSLSGNKP